MDETRKDLKQDLNQVLTAMKQMYEKFEVNMQVKSIASGIGQLERQDSNTTLVSSLEDTAGERAAIIEGENSNSFHALFTELLNQTVPTKGSISLPSGQSRSLPHPGMHDHNSFSGTCPCRGSEFSTSQLTDVNDPSEQLRKPSFNGKGRINSSTPLCRVRTQPSDVAPGTPLLSGSQMITMRRSTSGDAWSPTLAQEIPSDCTVFENDGESVAKDRDLREPLNEGLQNRTNKDAGAELLQVIRSGSSEVFQTFQALLQSDTSLEVKDEKGKTPLILAASLGKVDIVEQLLAYGADVCAVDSKRATALHYAIEKRHWPVMSLLLRSRDTSLVASDSEVGDIGINLSDDIGRTPLHYCTSFNCGEDKMKDITEELIACKADINAKDGVELPPVYYAIKNRKYAVVGLFLEKGADLNFERPETSAEIGKLLEDHLAGKGPSPTVNNGKMRKESIKGQQERKGSISLFLRRKSGPKT